LKGNNSNKRGGVRVAEEGSSARLEARDRAMLDLKGVPRARILLSLSVLVFLLCSATFSGTGVPKTSAPVAVVDGAGQRRSSSSSSAFATVQDEDAALEELRLQLVRENVGFHGRSETDMLTERINRRLGDGIEIDVFDDGLSEAEHMSVITKLARLAVEKEEQRKRRRREDLLKRAKQQGIELAEMLDLDPQNQLYQDMLSMQCGKVSDCTRGCEQSCMKKVSARGGACKTECRNTCSANCKGKMSCERPCEKKCRKDCEKRQGGSGGTNAETCRIESKKVCDIKCGNLPKPGPCISKCVEEKAKVCAFLSQEEAQSEQACRLKCGRHLCVNNKCTCSIYYTGDPLCMTPTAVKDMLPPRYAHCATPYSDGRFGKREGKNVTILSDRSRSLDFVRKYRGIHILLGPGHQERP